MGFKFEKYGLGGGSGGGSGVIDVTELPTENIEQDKIYRVTGEAKPTFWVAGTAPNGKAISVSFEEFFVLDGGDPFTISHTYVVESLPDTMEPANLETMTLPCYVLESTGIAYVTADGTSANSVPLSEVCNLENDGGWVDSVDDITPSTIPLTVYTIRPSSGIFYGIPAPVYQYNGTEWVEVGAGGSGGGIIDVTELPTEGIDEQSIYRVKNGGGADVYLVAQNRIFSFAEVVSAEGGGDATVTVNTQVVEALPDSLTLSDNATLTFYLYIVESTGIAYLNNRGTTMSFGEVCGDESLNKGWSTDIYSETEMGCYCTREIATYTYHAYKDGTWTELSNSGATVVELELGTDSGSTGTITDEQIASMQNDFFNTVLRISANGSTVQFTPLADLGESGCKYSVVNHTDSGFTLAVFTMDFSAKTYTYTNKDIT